MSNVITPQAYSANFLESHISNVKYKLTGIYSTMWVKHFALSLQGRVNVGRVLFIQLNSINDVNVIHLYIQPYIYIYIHIYETRVLKKNVDDVDVVIKRLCSIYSDKFRKLNANFLMRKAITIRSVQRNKMIITRFFKKL